MQIIPVGYRAYNSNQMKSKNVSSVNFNGVNQKLIPVNVDSFKTETAQKMYSKIQKYFQLIGREGSMKNIKIMDGDIACYESDVILSINKTIDKSKIRLAKKCYDNEDGITILEATFNKDGQMVLGELPSATLHFERTKPNVRRMRDDSFTYLPMRQNDKEWSANGRKPHGIFYFKDDSDAYDIFIELGRLNTSILK